MILYHGTMDMYAQSILCDGILLSKSKPYLDFGPGFYTTPDQTFALNTAHFRAKRYNRFRGKQGGTLRHPAVVSLVCDTQMLERLNVKCFEKATARWARFVIANRMTNDRIRNKADHNMEGIYDCVMGPTADGRSGAIDELVEKVDRGWIPLSAIHQHGIAPGDNTKWGTQYSFHTDAGLSCLTIKNVIYYD